VKRWLLLGALVACGQPHDPTCDKFLACSEAVQPMSTMDTAKTYGAGGTCWGSPDQAACIDICTKGLAALQATAGKSLADCN